MNVSYSFLCFIFTIRLLQTTLAQNEYEEDLSFQTFKPKKSFVNTKRKFNLHAQAGYTMSTIFGTEVNYLKDTLDALQKSYNLDSYNLTPSFMPYGQIDASFNFSKRVSLTLGLKYNMLGWNEIAKFENTQQYYRFQARYEFHYISVPISLQMHLNKYFTVFGGHTFSALVKNQIYIKEKEIVLQNTLIDRKEYLDFEKTTNVKSKVLIPQIFIGTHFGIDRLRFNLNFVLSPNFIHNNVQFNNFALEGGIIFKFFKDYDKF